MTSPFLITATALWLIAFFCSFTWLPDAEPEFVAVTLAALIAALSLNDAGGSKRREWPVPRSAALGAGCVFWLLALVSVLASQLVFVSWIYFFIFSTLPLTMAFFLVGHGRGTRLKYAERGIQTGLAGLALFALYQYFFRPELLYSGRVHQPLVDPNGLAAVFSLGLFLALKPFLRPDSRPSPAEMTYLACLIGALIVTGSRAAVLIDVFMGVILCSSAGWKNVPRISWVMVPAAAVAWLLLAALFAPDAASGPLAIAGNAVKLGVSGMFESRAALWAGTLRLITAHPWLGTGIGTFQWYYPEVRPVRDTTAGYMAHNDPLQFGAELGIGALFLFYGTVFLAAHRTWRAVRRTVKNSEPRQEILLSGCALAGFILHAHLTFNFHELPCLMLFGFTAASWHHATAKVLQDKDYICSAPRWLNETALHSLFLIMAVFLGVLATAPVYSQSLLARAKDALAQGQLEAFARDLNMADSFSGHINAQTYALAARLPLAMLAQRDVELDPAQSEIQARHAGLLLDKAHRFNPRDAEVLVQQAELSRLRRDPEKAETLLTDAMRLDPLNIPARLLLADLLSEQRRDLEAGSILLGGTDYTYRPEQRTRFPELLAELAALLRAQGRAPEAAALEKRFK